MMHRQVFLRYFLGSLAGATYLLSRVLHTQFAEFFKANFR